MGGDPAPQCCRLLLIETRNIFFYQDFFTVGNNFLEMRLSVTLALIALLCLIIVAEGRRSRHYGRRRHRPYHRHRSYRPRAYKTYKKTYHVVKPHPDPHDYEDYDYYHDHDHGYGHGHGYEEEVVVYEGPATDLVSALGLGGIGYVANSGGALHVVG